MSQDATITILYEDDDLLVADKPDNILSIPDRRQQGDDLLTRLQAQCNQRLYVVHRLDREVTGLILFAKNATAHRTLNEKFSQRQVAKHYRALVHGHLPNESGAWNAPLRQFGSGRMGVAEEGGKPSQTAYRVLKKRAQYTLLEAAPLTGRRHQIRVHCYAAGCPIVGDLRYGDRLLQSHYPRLMLHSESITLIAPTGANLSLTCPLPPSFLEVLENL